MSKTASDRLILARDGLREEAGGAAIADSASISWGASVGVKEHSPAGLVQRAREDKVEPAFFVEGLRLKFPGEQSLMFQDLSFAADPGEKVLLLGPSGCGKSTLLQVLSGMIPRAVEVPMKCAAQRIPDSWAYVFQDPDTQFCMPFVDEELAFVLENLSVPREEMKERMQGALKSVGLCLPDLHTPIAHLSQGMKQRLALASALLLQPEVLFLDEPSALLDPEGRRQIWEAIKAVSAGRTLIIVEHRIEEMSDYVDRVVLFGPGGAILGNGSPEHIFSSYQRELKGYGIWYPGVWDDYAVSSAGAKILREHEGGQDRGNAAGGNKPVLELTRFGVYRKQQPVTWVEEAKLYPGDFTAVIGPNGAGKSSLLLGLRGLLPFEGEYRLAGETVSSGKKRGERKRRESALSRIGFVFQNPELQFVTERVLDEVAYSLLVNGATAAEAEERAREMLARFGLTGLESRHPYQLSTGQKRRLSVATAMAVQPEVLLLDEPTFGQDARNTFAILELCEELRRAGTAILMVTHEMTIAEKAARSIWEIRNGRLLRQEDIGSVEGLVEVTKVIKDGIFEGETEDRQVLVGGRR
ncbi:ABC transporter ATP-binding protein [Paenibacillus sp. DMB20]|uniref:ABC transporter ATP-binding protein n=1 Tax=Paenibacillus sp. DMB20 TaxID=1642570 RepID=UPI0009E41A3E|nr:ATP-binding cassette domain-containing protein [Paenibacillus sp. DMB20]